MKFFSLSALAMGAAAGFLGAVAAHASVVTVDIHPASAAQIADDATLADATVIDLLIDSQADLVLSFDLALTTTGTIYNHPLESADDAAPNPALIPSNPSLEADSHVAFGSALGGDLSSPGGVFPLSVGAPLPPVTRDGLLTRITVLGDAQATITGQVFVSSDGVVSTSIPFDSLATDIDGDLNGDGFVGVDDPEYRPGQLESECYPGGQRLGRPHR